MREYEPEIVAFACRRLNKIVSATVYPDLDSSLSIRFVWEKCIGRMDPQRILLELRGGADGVLMLGCSADECCLGADDQQILKRFILLQKLLCDLSVSGARIRLEQVEESDGTRFTELIRDVRAELKALGPVRWEA